MKITKSTKLVLLFFVFFGAPGKAGLIWSGASPYPVIARLTGSQASVRRSRKAVHEASHGESREP